MTLLSIPEAARRLGCSKTHVYDLIADGLIPVVDISRSGAKRPKSRVSDTAIEAYMQRNTRTAA